MSLFSLKELKKSSIYFTPNFPSLQTKRYKFSFFKVFGFVLLFSFVVALLTTVILALTPAKEILFFIENEKLTEKAEQIKLMEQKISILTNELNSISSTTNRLKYAMMLGQIDSIDSSAKKIYDSLKKTNEKNVKIRPEGFVLKAFVTFINKYISNDSLNIDMIFVQPSDGVIVNKYNLQEGHLGIDYALKPNSPIFSTEDGLVLFSGYDINDGYSIILQHSNGIISKYKHCSQLLVSERMQVKKGEVIARSGNSGYNTSGPHLHFEIWKDGFAIDPQNFLISEGAANGQQKGK